MRPDLHLALIGYGLAGRVFHAPLIQHTPGLALHSIVSSQRDTLLRTFSDVHVRATPQDVFDDEAMGVVSPEMVGAYRSFAVAVRNEERAFAFWSYIAANGVSPEIRDAAERMAREELEHAKTLRRERRKAFFEDRRLGTAIREPYDLSSLEMEVCTRLEEHADMNGNKKEYRDLALEARMLSLDLASDPLQDPAPVGPPPPRSLDALCEWLADYYIDAGEHLLSQAARDRCQALATIAVKRLAVVRDLEKK